MPRPGPEVEHLSRRAKLDQAIDERRVRTAVVHGVVAIGLLGRIHHFGLEDALHAGLRS